MASNRKSIGSGPSAERKAAPARCEPPATRRSRGVEWPRSRPLDLDPRQELDQLRRERDLYLRLLELGALTEIEPFLGEALELVVELTGAQNGYLELRDPRDARRERRLVPLARLLRAGDRGRPLADLARHHRGGARHRADDRHAVGAARSALQRSRQRARDADRGGALRPDRPGSAARRALPPGPRAAGPVRRGGAPARRDLLPPPRAARRLADRAAAGRGRAGSHRGAAANAAARRRGRPQRRARRAAARGGAWWPARRERAAHRRIRHRQEPDRARDPRQRPAAPTSRSSSSTAPRCPRR